MGRKKNNDRFAMVDGRSDGAYTLLTDKMVRSKAYNSLSDSAARLLMVLKLQRQYFIGRDKQTGKEKAIGGNILNFTFSREVQKLYGYNNPNKVRRCMIELVENGFIDIVSNGWNTRTKTIYRYSSEWEKLDCGQEIELSRPAQTFINGRL